MDIDTQKVPETVRVLHCSVIANNKLYILFGKNGFMLDSIICWDFEKGEWENIKTSGDKIERRIGATIQFVKQKNSFYIFGGQDGDGFSSNQLFEVNLDTFNCKLVSKAIIDGTDYGVHLHSMLFDEKDLFYFFGGKNEKGAKNDFFRFSLSQNKWSVLKQEGSVPRPIFSHFSFHLDTTMILFDPKNILDLHVFDFLKGKWNKLNIDSKIKEISKEGCTITHDKLNKCFYIVGGISSEFQLDIGFNFNFNFPFLF